MRQCLRLLAEQGEPRTSRHEWNELVDTHAHEEQPEPPPQRKRRTGEDVSGEDRDHGAVHIVRPGAVEEQFAE